MGLGFSWGVMGLVGVLEVQWQGSGFSWEIRGLVGRLEVYLGVLRCS